MRRRIAVLVGAVGLLAGLLAARRPIAQAVARGGTQLSDVLHIANSQPESVDDGARLQLLHMRHAVLASMRADLLAFAEGEARFFADSGHYTADPYPAYWSGARAGNDIFAAQRSPHGWWTQISNGASTIGCAVAVGDIVIGPARPGEPVCGPRVLPWAPWKSLFECSARGDNWDVQRGDCVPGKSR